MAASAPGSLLAIALLLSACATHPPRPLPQAMPWAQRLRVLQSIEQFDLSGRMSAINGTEAVTAGVRWRQRDSDAVIDLSGPLGLGAAHIEQTAATLSVTSGQGVLYRGPAAGEKVTATLGFDPPLQSLRYWIVGASDLSPVTEESFDAEQRLTHLLQQGWQVNYEQYTRVQNQWLPQRLTVVRGSWRLRLVINNWQLAGHDADP
jgi:outer membrane lipoprotein LolB